MEINISDYLDRSQIQDIITDELRQQIKDHFKNESNAERLISNLSYSIVREEINKIMPNYESFLVDKVVSHIKSKDMGFNIFDFDSWGHGRNKSLGAIIVEKTIRENESLIKEKVIESITNKDYSDEAWNKFESLAESFTSNIYDFVKEMRNSNK